MYWIYPKSQPPLADQLKSQLGLGSVLIDLLIDRDLHEPASIQRFINPALRDLDDPFTIEGIKAASDRIIESIVKDEKVLVYGDYDVDGVTSTAQLCDLYQFYQRKPRYFVPHRVDEGYGLSTDAIQRALEFEQPDLFIAVDCGTSSSLQVADLRARGIDVIIIDHHTSKENLPEDCILVNPKVWHDETKPWYHLCSAGLVFKAIHAVLKTLRDRDNPTAFEIDPKHFLDLVALGTISDLVPLIGENRILAKSGLSEINRRRRPGINALIEYSGLGSQSQIRSTDLGFRLGPRINAGGRLDDATEAVNLLITKDVQRANDQAEKLESFNKQRQTIERAIVKKAEAVVATKYRDAMALVLYEPDWHAGVVGIVASRICRSQHRPTLVLGAEDNGDQIKGSGRSIEGIDLVEVLKPCAHLLDKWGGHPMAVGLSLARKNLEAFREAFETSIHNYTQGTIPEASIRVSATISSFELNPNFLESLAIFEPFGQDNPEPIFELKSVRLFQVRELKNGHISFALVDKTQRLRGIFWNGSHHTPPEGTPINIAFRLQWNEFRGQKHPQINLVDWKFPS